MGPSLSLRERGFRGVRSGSKAAFTPPPETRPSRRHARAAKPMPGRSGFWAVRPAPRGQRRKHQLTPGRVSRAPMAAGRRTAQGLSPLKPGEAPMTAPAAPLETAPPPRRWDPVVKLTHWTIVGAILANGLITEEGSTPHVWVGYALAATLALRLIWGVIGPAEARFAAFPPSPARALAHLREIAQGRRSQHASHNPLGALMVYAIWSTLAVIVVTGVLMANAPAEPKDLVAAPPAAVHSEARESDEIGEEAEAQEGAEGHGEEGPLAEVHETAVNLLYVLIVLHIAGVVFETRRSGRRIVLAMLPGRR
ncbi:cytochrome b/b6 domain-containing protein [Caulobacter vibrioides NA1000]|nr:cytochrome b/b6 domain-containing protein [Caulobacter vibrioides]YP_002518390.1 cytochrome b/b6 domain-containing protein [Caulobacter vibrioides NA1000]ACL96482.1 cytochrome b/b6 domain-containing protein [Caulobacter vibrioides NA1000]